MGIHKQGMIDLHSHTLLSDGVLVPSELVRRAEVKGYTVLAITDHVDVSNVTQVVGQLVTACEKLNGRTKVKVIPGCEVTHVPLALMEEVVVNARAAGAQLVVVHGETVAEPVLPGTNRRALELDIDVLAHPGLISKTDAALAAKQGIALELSTRRGHCWANGHVARMALEVGARLIIDTDSHAPEDLVTRDQAEAIAQGAGLRAADVAKLFTTAAQLVDRTARRSRG